ncbi:MAG: YIP1 family protein [Nanoarchaeota archaeon]|nr:YIP1 family protein [Nanoarchaeota archaeon]
MFKSKASFSQVVYLWMLSFSALVAIILILSAINMIYKPAAFLAYPLFITLLYLLAVSIKIVHNVSYKKAVFLILFSNAAAGFVRLAFFMAYAVLFFNPDGISYSLNLTNNTDGTLTATYALIYKDSGDPKETCHVTLPQGWVPANEEMREKIQEKIDRDIPTSDAAFYKSDDEFLFFVYGLPQGGHSINPKLTCNINSGSDYWIEKGFDFDNQTYSSQHISINETLLEMCDLSATNTKKTELRHNLGASFIGNDLGFEAVYQSPVGEDQDLTYIINNIRCYTGSGG